MNKDTLYCIFNFLTKDELLICSSINKQFNNLSNNELVWKRLFKDKFYNFPITENYKNMYKAYDSINNLLLKETEQDINNINFKLSKRNKGQSRCLDSSRQRRKYEEDFPHLIELYLCDEHITYIPKEIGMLTQLKVLHLERNLLKNIPSTIGMLTNLSFLSLNYNRWIQTIPVEIWSLTCLSTLKLSGNKIKSVSYGIGNLTRLENLYLAANGLSVFPPEIKKLTNLEYLYLENNNLEIIPTCVRNLTKLRNINISANPLRGTLDYIKDFCNSKHAFQYI